MDHVGVATYKSICVQVYQYVSMLLPCTSSCIIFDVTHRTEYNTIQVSCSGMCFTSALFCTYPQFYLNTVEIREEKQLQGKKQQKQINNVK